MNTFQNISITLPQQRIRDQIFYSTSKKWGRQLYDAGHDFTKDSFLRQLSCSTKNNKTVVNYDSRAQTVKLEQKLNQKNELLIKQSKWKNYYLKEEIYVLTQDILEYLNLISSQIAQNYHFHQYAKKLQKIISKLQVKKKTQESWIQFLGISSPQKIVTDLELISNYVQTSQTYNQHEHDIKKEPKLRQELAQIKEDNKRLLKNLNILTQEIENKQKQILNWQQKYSRLKLKKDNLKSQYIHLQTKLQELVIRKQIQKQDLEKTENFSKRKPHKNTTHFHTYSWDKNQVSAKSKFAFTSEQNRQKIEEQSSNLFVLSDTPYLQDKTRQIPICTGFKQTRKKLQIKSKQSLQYKTRKSMSLITNKSGQKTISMAQRKHSKHSQVSKKNKTQNEKIESVEIDQGQLPTNSLICQSQMGQTYVYGQILLSQAITIENLLDSIS